jgi:hypothetical protein
MTHLKLLGSWVRLPDGREGHIASFGIDGVSVQIGGRLVTAAAADLTAVEPPAAAPFPEPVRTQAPIKTCHAETDVVVHGVSVMRDGRWSDPQ